MHRSITFAIAAAMCALLPASIAGATPPLDVGFQVETVVPDEGPTYGPFVASGAAVDDGTMCPTGTTVDLTAAVSETPQGVNIGVVKRFTCDDGSGDFDVKLQVRIDRKGDNFSWVVLGGTGEYQRLHGTGSGFGIPFPGGVLDLYDGQLHVD
jgi:hypothetical protein